MTDIGKDDQETGRVVGYLSLIEVLAIHDDQTRRYGGADGGRDPGLLEAALYRRQTGYYRDLIGQAFPVGKPGP